MKTKTSALWRDGVVLFAVFTVAMPATMQADTFGSGTNAFGIDFVSVGNAGNAADATGYGAVPYQYRVSTHEISQDAITKATAGGLANVAAGAWAGNQPAANISWYEAAAFVNWLNTNSGKQAAYNLVFSNGFWTMQLWTGTNAWTTGGTNLYRHKDAHYFLPSENEWYKAAYYNPAGTNYFLYPTASNTAPTAVVNGTTAGTAVYSNVAPAPAAVTSAGGLSPFGTMGQSGNLWEWNETAWDGFNDSVSDTRSVRGGNWISTQNSLLSWSRDGQPPASEYDGIGFRVASVPEASTPARITSIELTNGMFSLSWANAGTNAVTVERRGSLTSGSWAAIASNNVSGSHTDTNPPAGSAFYRLRVVSGPPAPDPAIMRLIPAGSFSMGDAFSETDATELPVHAVDVSAFYMDKYEVTKALWDEVADWAATNGYDVNPASALGKSADHPAYSVTWYEAVKWSNARSEKEGLTPCYMVGGVVMKTGTGNPDCNFSVSGYRLPTEAEWEKAARGGLSGQRFPWGDTIAHSQANYFSDGLDVYDVSPTPGHHPTYVTGSAPLSSPVGSFAPNGYGLYDMAGNMSEWCWDWHDGSYYASSPPSDPQGPAAGSFRVFRGGSWDSFSRRNRVAARGNNGNPSGGSIYLGFRCARSAVQ